MLILADVEGVRAALMEQGARRVGLDYEDEPVAVTNGVFHSKISILSSETETHVIVGSGNLTFGGWGGNLEVFEHLHPSFAATAIEDTADFFEYLSLGQRARLGASAQCSAVANELRTSVIGKPRNSDIRLFHNLDGAILEKISRSVEELGGATRIAAASPYWDNGKAIDALCDAVGLDHAFVHAHPAGTVQGNIGSNWPTHAKSSIHAVALNVMDEKLPRLLHAKMFEINCKRGRLVLSGSANATMAALDKNRNIEACVARIHRNNRNVWLYSRSEPPAIALATDKLTEAEGKQVGVLRAVLEGDLVLGQILEPTIQGMVSVCRLTSLGPVPLANTLASSNGTFSFKCPGLELETWKQGRLILRVVADDGRLAEGFVSIKSFAGLVSRAGPLASRLFAVLAGTEAPADVAAIMSWFFHNPMQLPNAMTTAYQSAQNGGKPNDLKEVAVLISELSCDYVAQPDGFIRNDMQGNAAWARFIQEVFVAFRQRRGLIEFTKQRRAKEDTDDDDQHLHDTASEVPSDPAIEQALQIFDRLLALLISPENIERNGIVALDLTQYICERLRPDLAPNFYPVLSSLRWPDVTILRDWLEKLIIALSRLQIPDERRNDVAATIMTLHGAVPADLNSDRMLRSRLIALGLDLKSAPPSSDAVMGFQSVLLQTTSFNGQWERLQTVRTYPELTRSYAESLEKGIVAIDFSDLARAIPEEWQVMQSALTNTALKERIRITKTKVVACPKCYITLPKYEQDKLRKFSCATAKNCCGRVIVFVEKT